MTDFALNHEGKWRDGEAPKISGATYVVSYDQTNQAYHIDKSDYDDFVEWVADTWQTDYEPRGFWDEEEEDMIFECAQDYLDRRCINVRGV
jgi:hypothetical protein